MSKPEAGLDVYLVGGAVRDQLLGLPVTEHDWVVVGATPKDMLARGFKQVGKDFPVFLHPQTQDEYALARTERKSGKGYHGFDCYAAPDVTLEQDLIRRDLTVNAIAQAADGSFIDPYGGQADLQAGVLRHVSEAFAEDPLRILRAARFAARFTGQSFGIAAETMQLMQDMVSEGEADALVAERVWKETARAVMHDQPQVYFEVLAASGTLQRLWPELAAHFSPGHAAVQALQLAASAKADLEQRFAVLAQMIGDAEAIKRFCQRQVIPNDCRDAAVALSRTYCRFAQWSEQQAEQRLEALNGIDLWRRPERLSPLLDCAVWLAQTDGSTLNRDEIEQVAQAAQAVSPQTLIAQGHQGAALGQQLRLQRLLACQ